MVTEVPCSQLPPPSLPPGCTLELVHFFAPLMISSESASSRPMLGVGLVWGWGCPALSVPPGPPGRFHTERCLAMSGEHIRGWTDELLVREGVWVSLGVWGTLSANAWPEPRKDRVGLRWPCY